MATHTQLDPVTAMLLDGIREEARHAADLLRDALDAPGVPARQPLSLNRALAMAVALRRQEWRSTGLAENLPPGAAPSRARASRHLRLCLGRGRLTAERAARCRRFAVRTLLTWVRHFSWSARKHLGADVVISGKAGSSPAALPDLAAFAWKQRSL